MGSLGSGYLFGGMTDLLPVHDTLEIEAHSSAGESILELVGALDAPGSERLEELCTDLAEGTSTLVLDLTGLTFIDSAGLRSVLRLYGRCLKHQRELRILPAPEPVQRVFSLTRAADVLPFASANERPLVQA